MCGGGVKVFNRTLAFLSTLVAVVSIISLIRAASNFQLSEFWFDVVGFYSVFVSKTVGLIPTIIGLDPPDWVESLWALSAVGLKAFGSPGEKEYSFVERYLFAPATYVLLSYLFVGLFIYVYLFPGSKLLHRKLKKSVGLWGRNNE